MNICIYIGKTETGIGRVNRKKKREGTERGKKEEEKEKKGTDRKKKRNKRKR